MNAVTTKQPFQPLILAYSNALASDSRKWSLKGRNYRTETVQSGLASHGDPKREDESGDEGVLQQVCLA